MIFSFHCILACLWKCWSQTTLFTQCKHPETHAASMAGPLYDLPSYRYPICMLNHLFWADTLEQLSILHNYLGFRLAGWCISSNSLNVSSFLQVWTNETSNFEQVHSAPFPTCAGALCSSVMATAAMETAFMMTNLVTSPFYQQAIALPEYPVIHLP